MAHYAFLDENNIVTSVIVGKDEGTDGIDWEQKYGEIKGQTCKRTSYNTREGHHHNGGTPFRGNAAGPGYVYDLENNELLFLRLLILKLKFAFFCLYFVLILL